MQKNQVKIEINLKNFWQNLDIFYKTFWKEEKFHKFFGKIWKNLKKLIEKLLGIEGGKKAQKYEIFFGILQKLEGNI